MSEKITPELIASLKSDDITIREHRRIIKVVGERVDEVWRYICKVSRRKSDWYAFRNDVRYGHGDGSSGGEFDPDKDAEFVELGGDYDEVVWQTYNYNTGLPTQLLYEDDFKSIVDLHTKKAREAHEKKVALERLQETSKQRVRAGLVASIKQKLTSEELSIISFKKA